MALPMLYLPKEVIYSLIIRKAPHTPPESSRSVGKLLGRREFVNHGTIFSPLVRGFRTSIALSAVLLAEYNHSGRKSDFCSIFFSIILNRAMPRSLILKLSRHIP